MIVVPGSFREMPRWWVDAAGRAWLDTLPQRVDDRCRRWGLSVDGEVMHGSNSLVVPVRRGENPLILRLAPPGDDVLAEAEALRLWDGRGTVRLHDVDVDDRAMLLERLDGARSLAGEPLERATRMLAGLITRLAVPVPAGVRGTDQVAAEHAETFEPDWAALGEPFPRAQLDAAISAARERSEHPPARFAANGDLHFEQVLAGTREPWLVVDPVLLRGDPEYDLGRVLWSRLDETADDAHVRSLFDLFVESADVPPERARAWVLIRSASYLLWGLDRGLTEDPPRCRRLLNIFS
ncbi:aminoglycoside phosphotransferase family protein [Microbacterium sp. DT81.1]|uniref:aminoglycoside phosphotransferase family protein n=1 Tax=Microbacterium sp. DT81.1 TaxID=3393413 RepID=UPI003CF92DCA